MPSRSPTHGSLDQSRLMHLVGYAASRASIELKKTFAQHLGALDLKAVEFSILVLVAANPDVNQKELGAALDVSAPNMAITLDRLVELGEAKSGDLALLIAFGAGLAYAAPVVRVP